MSRDRRRGGQGFHRQSLNTENSTAMSITGVNTRNQLRGTVINIRRGSVMSEVEIETAVGIVSAVVTTSSVERLPLREGDAALALFKATDVLVAKLD
jgi:molybdopterin-binding protein